MLIKAPPEIRKRVDGAALVIVGGGPCGGALAKPAERVGVAGDVVFTWGARRRTARALCDGGRLCDAVPNPRFGSRRRGPRIVFLEASATGVPVGGGNSGAPRNRPRRVKPAALSTAGLATKSSRRSAACSPTRNLAHRMGAPPPMVEPGLDLGRPYGPAFASAQQRLRPV